VNETGITIATPGEANFNADSTGRVVDRALPVELVAFSARLSSQNTIVLEWTTASEKNNYGFEVERQLGNGDLGTWGLGDSGTWGNGETENRGNGETENSASGTGGRNGDSASGAGWEKVGFVPGHGTVNTQQYYVFTDGFNPQSIPIYRDNPKSVRYRLRQIDTDGSFRYSHEVEATYNLPPTTYHLEQNYPNPFNSSTLIRFQIREFGLVNLKVFDVLGREVATLINEYREPGIYSVQFDTRPDKSGSFASGVYFYRLQTERFTDIKRMVLMR
jgi:hypothetical protein